MSESVIRTLDASRRVGWARYYDAAEEVEALRKALHDLADAVMFHPRIHSQDPIIGKARGAYRM